MGRGGRGAVEVRDVLAVDRASRGATARHAAPGDLARRDAALLRRRRRAESQEPGVQSPLHPDDRYQPAPVGAGRGGRGSCRSRDRQRAAPTAGGHLEVEARLGLRGRRRGVPRSRRSPGTRLRRHTDEDPLVRQSPLQPDPLHLLRPERPTWGKGLTRRAAVHRGLAQRTCNRSPLGGHFLCMRAESGETEARARFEGLFAGHYGELLRFAQRRVGIDAAGDVVAETFLIAWRRLPEVSAEHARAWLYMTARYVIANELRARQRRDRLSGHTRDDIATDRAVAGDHATVIAEQIRVRAVLESLSQMDQEVLRLTEWEQLDLTEAAAVVAFPVWRLPERSSRQWRRPRSPASSRCPGGTARCPRPPTPSRRIRTAPWT